MASLFLAREGKQVRNREFSWAPASCFCSGSPKVKGNLQKYSKSAKQAFGLDEAYLYHFYILIQSPVKSNTTADLGHFYIIDDHEFVLDRLLEQALIN